MKRILVGAVALALSAIPGSAQSLDDLNIQFHGYATQGFLYTNQNNIYTTNSSSGSPAWTEAVVNVSSRPTPGLRVAVQARYFLLGNLGNAITLDWAAADYTFSDKFGVRFGKVKTPSGLFNELQDIDPSYSWALLPQSVYLIESRNSFIAHYGGVAYGTIGLGEKLGKLEYRGWGGQIVLAGDDGFFLNQREAGVKLTNGMNVTTIGEALHWKTPLRGFMIGASNSAQTKTTSALTLGPLPGNQVVPYFNTPNYFAIYQKNRVMFAGEYRRNPVLPRLVVPGIPVIHVALDERAWYGMASYKVTNKLTAGVYQSQTIDHAARLGPARYSKDWVASGRYDFNEFLYAKAEEHFIKGTFSDFDTDLNPNGLKPDTKLSVLKMGVSF